MVRFKLNKAAFRKNVLKADWMRSEMEQEARSRAGSDNHIKTFYGFDRAKSIIYPNKGASK